MLVLHHKSLLAQFLPWLSGKPEKMKIQTQDVRLPYQKYYL
jgi:hypothetical protein